MNGCIDLSFKVLLSLLRKSVKGLNSLLLLNFMVFSIDFSVLAHYWRTLSDL